MNNESISAAFVAYTPRLNAGASRVLSEGQAWHWRGRGTAR